jgi:hypothetical protein
MNRFIEPRGWSDMTQEKKERLVVNLASAGMLNMNTAETGNDLLDKMGKSHEGSLVFLHAKQIIATRGLEVVAQGVQSKAQADTMIKVFGAEVESMIPAQAMINKKHQHDSSGLSR